MQATTHSTLSKRLLGTLEPIVDRFTTIANQRRTEGKQVLNFGQAAVSLVPPSGVEKAINECNPFELPGLCQYEALPALRSATADYCRERVASPICNENVLITSGANNAFHLLNILLTQPGNEVMLLTPYFFNHHMTITLQGGSVITTPLDATQGLQPNLEAIAKTWTPATKTLVVVNPGNPTGVIVNNDSLHELEKFVRSKNGLLVVDESYANFDYRQAREKSTKFNLDTTVLIGSFSKSFSLAGWRIGYLIGEPSLVSALQQIRNLLFTPNIYTQRITAAALAEKEPHFTKIIPVLSERRALLLDRLSKSNGFGKILGNGGVFLWAELKGNQDSMGVALDLANQHGIITSPGVGWGGEGHLRFSYGLANEETIADAGKILAAHFKA